MSTAAGRGRQAYWYLAPAFVLLVVISLYPVGYAIQRSLYHTAYLALGKFAGLANYLDLLTSTHGWKSVWLSLVFMAGSVGLAIPFSLLLAVVVSRPLPFRTTIRTLLLLPWVISQTIGGLLWAWLLNPSFGPVSYALGRAFDAHIAFFQDPAYAMAATIVANVWQSYGLGFVLLLAALQTVPRDLLEAARMDGATKRQMLFSITLPLIRPAIAIAAIMLTLHSLNMVTMILVLTGGGPAGATETLSVRVFNEAFQFQNMGLASAIGVVIALLNVVFSIAYLKVLRKDGDS